jgi:hypothetical protein
LKEKEKWNPLCPMKPKMEEKPIEELVLSLNHNL